MPLRAPHILAVPAACLLAASACGGQSGSGGAGSTKLEQLIKVDTARDLLTDTGVPRPPANSSRVQEAANQIDVECESSSRREYECAIGVGDWARHCAMATNAAVTRIRWRRCGMDHPPEVENDYVDCEIIGPVASADDPRGDVTDNTLPPGRVITGADALSVDLRRVRVAVSDDAICVAWDVGSQVKPPYSVNFWAYPRNGSERLALTAGLPAGEPPGIGTGLASVDGRVGIRGNSVSVVVERDAMPETDWQALDGPFGFAAHVSRWIRGTPRQPYAYVDELNSSTGRASYP